MQSIVEWLSALDLNRYAQVFAENDIDLEVLPSLSEPDLEPLGVSLGHRKKLLKAIADLKAGSSAQRAAGAPNPAASINLAGERRQLTVMFAIWSDRPRWQSATIRRSYGPVSSPTKAPLGRSSNRWVWWSYCPAKRTGTDHDSSLNRPL